MFTHSGHINTCCQCSVEDTGAVNVGFAIQFLGDRRNFIKGVLVVARSASEVGRVLYAHQGTVWIMAARTLRFSHGFADLLRRHEAALPINQSDGCPAKGGITASFVAINVCGFVAHDFIARNGVGSKCNGVGHRSGCDEQAGFLSKHRGHTVLKFNDGRVVPQNIITDGCSMHGCPHGFRWLSDRIGAEINSRGRVFAHDSGSTPSFMKAVFTRV